MKYRIELRKSAEKALGKLDAKKRGYVYVKLLELGENPRDRKCEKLKGIEQGYRKVAWPYRILYTINDEHKIVDVYLIAHREEAYR
ncbi:MAG: type II toxin-antitoxin system RelE/ParE family toxin [Chlamydiae bacterium]|nr:type II toxin-antitoxin system RelE/ParE family toxin [Chlamydiota bacterium]MBI3267081.1 type II toxin-antitoxin system RelE/ParE family toxin [Chlamydiota bacterium]